MRHLRFSDNGMLPNIFLIDMTIKKVQDSGGEASHV